MVREVEQGDLVVREILYIMAMNPDKPGDMKDHDYPPDMKIVIRLMTLYKFRDGKICGEFTTYNLLGTELDFAQGDLKKVVAKILKMEPF